MADQDSGRGSLVRDHFGVIIAATIAAIFSVIVAVVTSIAAKYISDAQVALAESRAKEEDKRIERENERDRKARSADLALQLEADKERAKLEWRIQATRFVAEYREQILSTNVREQELIRAAMTISFPDEILVRVLPKITDTRKREGRDTALWEEAARDAQDRLEGKPSRSSTNRQQPSQPSCSARTGERIPRGATWLAEGPGKFHVLLSARRNDQMPSEVYLKAHLRKREQSQGAACSSEAVRDLETLKPRQEVTVSLLADEVMCSSIITEGNPGGVMTVRCEDSPQKEAAKPPRTPGPTSFGTKFGTRFGTDFGAGN